MKKISVIIPFYNDFKVIDATLKSVFSQTYSNLEVILVDDGSEPDLSEKKNELLNKYQIKIIRQNNQGAPAARNQGLRHANGNFVIFWDSDVIAKPNMLEKMYNKLSSCDFASYSYCNFYYGNKKMPARKFDPEFLKKRNYIHSTSLIRKNDCIQWDEELSRFQDWDFWLNLLDQGKRGVWIDEYLFKIQTKKDSISDWLPRFAYYPPFSWLPGISSKVQSYKKAKSKVKEKHNLL